MRISIGLVFVLALTGCAGRQNVENAVKRGRWATLITLAEQKPDTMPIALRAHALIAVGHGDNAACLFSGLSARDKTAWLGWARHFEESNARLAVARYLLGDSLARMGRFAEADRELTTAIDLDRKDVLALSARGVLRSLRHDWTGIEDLRSATGIEPGFGGAWSDLGYAELASGRSADGAADAFQAALKADPGSARALAGSSYAAIALGEWSSAQEPLRRSTAIAGCEASQLASNLPLIAKWVTQNGSAGREPNDEEPGVEMARELRTLETAHDLSTLGSIGHELGLHPELKPMYDNAMATIRQKDPSFYPQVLNQIAQDASWVRPGGGALSLLNTVRSMSMDLGVGVGIKVGGAMHVDVGPKADVSFSLAPMMDNFVKQTNQDYSGYRMMLSDQKPPVQPGGANTSLAAAWLDKGNWPFLPLYSLAYKTDGGAK